MSDRLTPETDGELKKLKNAGMDQAGKWIQTNFARKLERERDDARKEFLIANDKMVEAECRVREIASVLERVKRERDEAREALMKIEDRCVDCEDACDDLQKIRDIAVKALEEPK